MNDGSWNFVLRLSSLNCCQKRVSTYSHHKVCQTSLYSHPLPYSVATINGYFYSYLHLTLPLDTGCAPSSRASSRIWVLWFSLPHFCIINIFFLIRSSTSSHKPDFIFPLHQHVQLPPIPSTTNTATAMCTHSPLPFPHSPLSPL